MHIEFGTGRVLTIEISHPDGRSARIVEGIVPFGCDKFSTNELQRIVEFVGLYLDQTPANDVPPRRVHIYDEIKEILRKREEDDPLNSL